jgi:hypothetical protein
MARKGSKRSSKQCGGEFSGRSMSAGGAPSPLTPGVYNPEGAPMAKSQYYTITGGARRRKGKKSQKRSKKSKKSKSKRGGEGVLATAAVPFGLLALQRYFKGSKTSKQGVAKIGRSFKRTFRRHRGGGAPSPLSPQQL